MDDSAQRPVVVGCGVVCGVDAVPVRIEATMRDRSGPPRILGSVDGVVRESCHRLLTAFAAEALPRPRGTPLVNLAPAGVPKRGSGFDLPMALALAGAGGVVPRDALAGVAALGEITLDGEVLPVAGAVAIGLAVRRDSSWRILFAHPDDARRAAVVPGLCCVPVRRLAEAVQALAAPDHAPSPLPAVAAASVFEQEPDPGDVADLRGHETPKTAALVAAAGHHDLLLVGPPGSGKSALLRRLPALLPELSDTERLEVLRIHTVRHAGAPRVAAGGRPWRRPHHSSSGASVLGGGGEVRPGEATLAHHGVLFLDELPEFRREVLEGLRQPLEDRCVVIGRARQTLHMPADFLLVAAMNPCPCGYAGDPTRTCRCTSGVRTRYRTRISGPLLDRFDLRVDVPTQPAEVLAEPPEPQWHNAVLRERVAQARATQQGRNPDGAPNGRLDGPSLELVLAPTTAVEAALQRAMRSFGLSARARLRLLRTARTLADLDDRPQVDAPDVLQAARLRLALEGR